MCIGEKIKIFVVLVYFETCTHVFADIWKNNIGFCRFVMKKSLICMINHKKSPTLEIMCRFYWFSTKSHCPFHQFPAKIVHILENTFKDIVYIGFLISFLLFLVHFIKNMWYFPYTCYNIMVISPLRKVQTFWPTCTFMPVYSPLYINLSLK